MAWGVDYRALWDNDKEGRAKFDEATKHFGQNESDARFRLLPLPEGRRKQRLENLFAEEDLKMMADECGSTGKFTKTIVATYYSPKRKEVLAKVSSKTVSAFEEVFQYLW